MVNYSIATITDTLILITDSGQGKTVTNDAENVIATLSKKLNGIGQRNVYYLDSLGERYDQLKHTNEAFTGFAPCSPSQQVFFTKLIGRV